MASLSGDTRVTVTLPAELVQAAKAVAGPQGLSAYVSNVVLNQLSMAGLQNIVSAYEAHHGRLADSDITAIQEKYFSTREATFQQAL